MHVEVYVRERYFDFNFLPFPWDCQTDDWVDSVHELSTIAGTALCWPVQEYKQ